jgi:hypothetical protein
MAAKHSILGLQNLLDAYLNTYLVGSGSRIGLFTGNLNPDYSLVDADYLTSQPAFGGYATQALTPWAPAYQDVAHARSTAPTYTFTVAIAGAAENVYGYFITDATEVYIIVAERDPAAPVAIGDVAGQTYKVTPNISDINE